MSKDDTFDEYEDLYKLTSKTVDSHIEFYKKKKSYSDEDLWSLYKKLARQAKNFDKRRWTENWHNWHKNMHAFEKHQFEARYLIENFLTDVLEELLIRLIDKYKETLNAIPDTTKPSLEEFFQRIKKDIKQIVKQELANQKRKSRKKT